MRWLALLPIVSCTLGNPGGPGTHLHSPDSGAAPSPDGGTPPLPDGGSPPSDAGVAGTDAGAAVNFVTSITKDGVTWTFAQPILAGQFVNGDYFVVGPATVTAIDPPPMNAAPYLNGSVVNLPTADAKSGFDQRYNDGVDQSWWFSASDRSYPPLALTPGSALVSAVSLPTCTAGACPGGGTCGGTNTCQLPEVMSSSNAATSPVSSYSVLTVLSAVPAADAFRPSYCDRTQSLYYAHNVQRGLLQSLAPPNPSSTPALAQFESWFRRPWIDTPGFGWDAPASYMPAYGAQVGSAVGFASLALMLNVPAGQKINLTNYLVQYGIDLYGCVKAGYAWSAFGGHRSGRKLPIIFAGVLLNEPALQNVSAAYPDHFGEDMQSVYINKIPGGFTAAWQGATAIYGGHYGVHPDGTPVSAGLYGPYEQLQPAQWPLISPTEQLGEAYRRCCTSMPWVGEALAMRMLHAQTAWNYPAFFDYVDRWMEEDDTVAVAAIKSQSGFDYSSSWERQKQTAQYYAGEFGQPSFVDDMWQAYRASY